MNGLSTITDELTLAIQILEDRLINERSKGGIWEGVLSSSAVSTAVASFALARVSPYDSVAASKSRCWLINNINKDGGWGDTPESISNSSATLLARAALLCDDEPSKNTIIALDRSREWIKKHFGGISHEIIIEGVKKSYGKDYTFSAPILTICALSPMFEHDPRVWKYIPRLPFEMAVLPHKFYHLLKLPVVSYALPALISVGIAQFKHNPGINPFLRIIRMASVRSSLDKLTSITPSHGGFLEAAPLTAFVAACLGCSGYSSHPVVKKALNFLRNTMRSDGSWSIDTNLSHWVTTLAIKAFDGSKYLLGDIKNELVDHFLSHQFKKTHPFTHAKAGGWGWTHLPGSVPDADDTAAVLIALSILSPNQVTDEVNSGIRWLLNLMNSDGGIPTFCKGWGRLPFDKSCPDISSHALQAFFKWLPYVNDVLKLDMEKAITKLIRYLTICRDADNAWNPLWFGAQNTLTKTNRIYGTSTVLINLYGQLYSKVKHIIEPALKWIINAQNKDGGWGGEPESPSLFETTALVVAALSLYSKDICECKSGVSFLINKIINNNGSLPSSPIGFYFASLWYDEKLYPLVFGLRALRLYKDRYAL